LKRFSAPSFGFQNAVKQNRIVGGRVRTDDEKAVQVIDIVHLAKCCSTPKAVVQPLNGCDVAKPSAASIHIVGFVGYPRKLLGYIIILVVTLPEALTKTSVGAKSLVRS
jgi:hypothetical protein